ncbi:MAG: bifunctional DNA-formamidopyrimidine glycosylase/DNA-(apurinic or apyrimidinic site) lyase [Clostridia bacterium]|nr:bifunctional DNA-formamidopyrimidine glycosylase/DNA-(apurinic or apyrimidinic site) lyase [Clostridia bacterium]
MPELPEVETIRRNLQPVLCNNVLASLELRRMDIVQFWPQGLLVSVLEAQTLLRIDRHGKYLLFYFTGDLILMIHLRMTGKLLFLPGLSAEDQIKYTVDKHTHALLNFSSGTLIFNDVRRFGRLTVIEQAHLYSLPGGYNTSGPDAISDAFTPEILYNCAQRHAKMPVKSLLLDQSCVAGIGNIYADESLYRSHILPDRPSGSLSLPECTILQAAIKSILHKSIELGGTSFRDYRNAGNIKGAYLEHLMVYGKEGKFCQDCGQVLFSKVIGGRRSVYCISCQH